MLHKANSLGIPTVVVPKLEKSICIDFMKAYEATILNNYLVLYIEHLLEWAAGKEAL